MVELLLAAGADVNGQDDVVSALQCPSCIQAMPRKCCTTAAVLCVCSTVPMIKGLHAMTFSIEEHDLNCFSSDQCPSVQ